MRLRRGNEVKAEWRKLDLKARTIILSTVSDNQLVYISECRTPLQMMTKFSEIYCTKSTALQILCRGKIDQIKLHDFETVEDFFVGFEKLVNEFKPAGGTIDEAEKMRYLIKALPLRYSYIGDFIGVIPENQRTVDYVKLKIKEKNLIKGHSDKGTSVSTFNEKTNKECYGCGKIGHIRTGCRYEKRQGESSRQQGQG